MQLDCPRHPLDLSRPRVMGVLNVTPDSFSDGGDYLGIDAALERADAMVAEGAAVIDVGGESTRPGADLVPVDEELRRVIPVVERLAERLSVPISIDTSKPEVMTAAVRAGAELINDVNALRAPGALEAAAAAAVPVCLMHRQGTPKDMQKAPHYEDVVEAVHRFLVERLATAERAGIPPSRIVLDPGFGFGKNTEHNLALFRALARITDIGRPVLVGLSRKSLLGHLTGRPIQQRAAASVAAALLAAQRGAHLIRAHDVGATVDALAVHDAVCH